MSELRVVQCGNKNKSLDTVELVKARQGVDDLNSSDRNTKQRLDARKIPRWKYLVMFLVRPGVKKCKYKFKRLTKAKVKAMEHEENRILKEHLKSS